MAVTDLTGYTWVGNDNLPNTDLGTFSISTIVIEATYNDFRVFYNDDTRPFRYEMYVSDDYMSVVLWRSDTGWTSIDKKTIHITGGADATNTTLIQWLQDNGTLTPPAPTTKTYLKTSNKYVNKINGYSIKKIIVGSTIIPIAGVKNTPLWPTPNITLSENILSTEIVEGVTKYKLYDNDEYIGYIDENNVWNAYTPIPQLSTPSNLSVSGTIISFDAVENAESYEVFAGDVSIGEFEPQQGYQVKITGVYQTNGGADYESSITINDIKSEVSKNGVTSNIPYTHEGITSFEVKHTDGLVDSYGHAIKLISGTAHIKSIYFDGSTDRYDEDMTVGMDYNCQSDSLTAITLSSDCEFHLGYWND